MITATNKHTGEIVELKTGNLQEIMTAWKIAQEYFKVADALKAQLKELVPKYVPQNLSEEVDGYMFRITNVQRMNYDKAIMRKILDEDLFDMLLKPDKPLVDKYLKEHLDEMGGDSTVLRETMIEEGKPYQIIKLEKLNRE